MKTNQQPNSCLNFVFDFVLTDFSLLFGTMNLRLSIFIDVSAMPFRDPMSSKSRSQESLVFQDMTGKVYRLSLLELRQKMMKTMRFVVKHIVLGGWLSNVRLETTKSGGLMIFEGCDVVCLWMNGWMTG